MGKDGVLECGIEIELTEIKGGAPVGHVPGRRDTVLYIGVCMRLEARLAGGN